MKRSPNSMAAIASPMPVLPDEDSTITPPRFRRPDSSAATTMLRAMRSFMLPPGLFFSTFNRSIEFLAGTGRPTIGVLPISSLTLVRIMGSLPVVVG